MTPGQPAAGPGAAAVPGELRALGRGDGIAAIGRLAGGSIADAWLIIYADGAKVVGKTVTAALPGVFAVEATADQRSGGQRPDDRHMCLPGPTATGAALS